MFMMILRPVVQNVKKISNTGTAKSSRVTQSFFQRNSYASYGASKIEGDPKLYTDCEISKDLKLWKYVERLLPKQLIQEPPKKEFYPSGWKPVTANPENLGYFVERTKNHLVPVYLIISHRGLMKITRIRRISGDIWKLKFELLSYLEKINQKPVGVQVDEIGGCITFRGDHVWDVKNWLAKRGF